MTKRFGISAIVCPGILKFKIQNSKFFQGGFIRVIGYRENMRCNPPLPLKCEIFPGRVYWGDRLPGEHEAQPAPTAQM